MKKEHVPFNRLSELCDGMLSRADVETVRRHLDSCPGCTREFEDLGKLLRMVSCLQMFGIREGDRFARSTLEIIRRRRRVYYYKRIIPYAAVAAMMIFAVGVDRLREGSVDTVGSRTAGTQHGNGNMNVYSASPVDDAREINSFYDIQRTLSVLRKNGARIVMVSDSYIEGEAPVYGFDRMHREFESHHRGWATTVNVSEGESRDNAPSQYPRFLFRSGDGDRKLVRFRVNLE